MKFTRFGFIALGVFLTLFLSVGQPYPVYAAAIDIGAGATDRASTQASGNTFLQLGNTANATGTLTSFEIWFNSTGGGVVIGTAWKSGGTGVYKTRDWESIGTVAAGSEQTFSGKNCSVTSGDLLGIYWSSGNIEATTSGGAGCWYKSGNQFDGGEDTYFESLALSLSTYGIGATPVVVPTVTTQAATSVEATTATGNGTITNTGGGEPSSRGVEWGTSTGNYSGGYVTGAGSPFTAALVSLPTGTTIYCRAKAYNSAGWGYGSEVTFLTKPAPVTGMSASENNAAYSTITWTDSTGATSYHVWRGASDLGHQTSTYNDTGGVAPLITVGTSVASDGTSTAQVDLSLSGTSVADGTSYTYKVVAENATGSSTGDPTDAGYRKATALTYQWNRSAADSDLNYSVIDGATNTTYPDTAAPSNGDGRYYTCTLVSTGASNTPGTSTANRGYRQVLTGTIVPSEKDFGILEKNTSSETGLSAFTFTNTGNVAIDITISGTDLVGGGVTWTLSSDASVGENIYGLKAGLKDGDYTVTVKKSSFETLKTALGTNTTQDFGLKLFMPSTFTDPTDISEKSATVTLLIAPN